MANTILQNDYNALNSTHYVYQRNRDRWEFLYNSYVGGEPYRNAGYLTKYSLETEPEYRARLNNTPLDNHCQSVIATYVSFLFRQKPDRDFEDWENYDDVESFLRDADMEGRSFDAFMKQVSIWTSVFGHSWVIMTKPNLGQMTQAQEIAAGVRPYVNLLTPLVVSDWRWERLPNGRYQLTYLKYVEEIVDRITVVKEWTKDTIKTWILDDMNREARMEMEELNMMGIIPAILVYNQRSVVKDLGVSDINDIADLQRQIYNLQSENEQAIRLDGHPSLVVPPTAQLGSGAGAIIQLQDGSDPGLNPYYLESGGTSVDNIHKSIDKLVEAIDRISFTGGVRSTIKKVQSGVAMEVEFNLLSAKLSEKADNLELAEEQIWQMFGMYQMRIWMGEVKYPDSFSIQDDDREFQHLQQAKSAATDPVVFKVIDKKLLEMLDEEGAELLIPGYQQIEAAEQAYEVAEAIEDAAEAAGQDIEVEAILPVGQECPIATQDIAVNLANRQNAIDTANYGPLNPNRPNTVFWMALADKWSVSESEARQSTCGNCAAFNMTTSIKTCIEQGLAAGGSTGDEWDTVAAGNLGYCEAFDFKCASNRTCDAWVTGGPITD